jgi:hypothetical protein
MTPTLTPAEVITAQKAVMRAKRHTPNLAERAEREMDALLDKLLETDRRPGDFADDGYGPNELAGVCR